LFFNNREGQVSREPWILTGSERQHVLNVNLQLFASIVRGYGAFKRVEGTTTSITTTRCIYVVTTNDNSELKDFSDSLMC
jgi:hypothetical protein